MSAATRVRSVHDWRRCAVCSIKVGHMAPGDRPGELRWMPNAHWAGFGIVEPGYRCEAHATKRGRSAGNG